MMAIGLTCKSLSTVLFTAAVVLYKPPAAIKEETKIEAIETVVNGDGGSVAKEASPIGQSAFSKKSLETLDNGSVAKGEVGAGGDVGMVNLACAP